MAEYVQLAHPIKPTDHFEGWFASIKLDGMRATWDGGVSRNDLSTGVPWGNTIKDKVPVRATGLWSRSGKVIHAPQWWLDGLPKTPIEGELWLGTGTFQSLISEARSFEGDWTYVKFLLFDAPPPVTLFGDRDINVRGDKFSIRGGLKYFMDYGGICKVQSNWPFETRLRYLKTLVLPPNVAVHEQTQLSFNPDCAKAELDLLLEHALFHGHEGMIVKSGTSPYQCKRTRDTLKVKPWHDAEATIVGYTTGRETDKGSKLLGMMGALIVQDEFGKQFKLSGFTDEERRFEGDAAFAWAASNPEQKCPDWITNPWFPRGTLVTYKYRELTDDNIPKEGRYWRKRVEE